MISDKDILRAYKDAAQEEVRLNSLQRQLVALELEVQTCQYNLSQYRDQISFNHQEICNPKPVEPLPDSPDLVVLKTA